VSLKAILIWLSAAFTVWWIIEDPAGAAHVVHNIGSFLNSVAHDISSFFATL
jgi:hypothetical protein